MALSLGLVLVAWIVPASSQENAIETKGAAKSAVDPSGTWKWEREFRDTMLRSTLTLNKEGDNVLTGTLQTIFGDGGGPGGDPVKIDNGKLDGDIVTFSVTRSFNDNEFTIDYVGKYADGELGGTYTLNFGNGPRDIEWKAKRYKKLYELRIYTTHDGKLPNLQARFRDHTMRIFEKHGMENIIYWTVSEGAKGEDDIKDNLLVYIIAHKDEAARKASWKAFMDDPEWKKVAEESEKDGPILAKAPRSILMTTTDFSADMKPKKDSDVPRLFELRQYNDGPDRVPSTIDRFGTGEKDIFTKHGMETVSFWSANDNSAFIYLLAHKDREASRKSWQGFGPDFREFMTAYRARPRKEQEQPATQTGERRQRDGGHEVRFLVPTDYSPIK